MVCMNMKQVWMKRQKGGKKVTNEKEQSLAKADNSEFADKNFSILSQTDYITTNKKLVFLCLFFPIRQVIIFLNLIEIVQCFIC